MKRLLLLGIALIFSAVVSGCSLLGPPNPFEIAPKGYMFAATVDGIDAPYRSQWLVLRLSIHNTADGAKGFADVGVVRTEGIVYKQSPGPTTDALPTAFAAGQTAVGNLYFAVPSGWSDAQVQDARLVHRYGVVSLRGTTAMATIHG